MVLRYLTEPYESRYMRGALTNCCYHGKPGRLLPALQFLVRGDQDIFETKKPSDLMGICCHEFKGPGIPPLQLKGS